MKAGELQRYLYEHIPISEAMGVRVVEAGDEAVQLNAPLRLNINHHRTAFGGSISTLATLACWSHAHLLLQNAGIRAALVIQRHEIDYLKPITGDFDAASRLPDGLELAKFFDRIAVRGKGRITMEAEVRFGGVCCAWFKGQFVALSDSE